MKAMPIGSVSKILTATLEVAKSPLERAEVAWQTGVYNSLISNAQAVARSPGSRFQTRSAKKSRSRREFVKSDANVTPLPNPARHPYMAWDAFVYTSDPDGLAADFAVRGATFSKPLADTHDGLRGFEVTDPDGYVLFFGRPQNDE
ncbi:MAG: hypothetical protein ABR975_01405 [Vulcanimicrobiaceae bacterium]|jgi:hypothetical protein